MVKGVFWTDGKKGNDMNWTLLILIGLVAGGIYFFAKARGKKEQLGEVMDHEAELDREELDHELEDKRNSNAWDNLNDTLDDLGRRK